jgi:uncharacterized protein
MLTQPQNKYSSVYRTIDDLDETLRAKHPDLARIFRACYPNTLETTTELLEDGTSFVFTGDIPAMWLRDSSAQVRPYVALCQQDTDLQRLLKGVIGRQAHYLLIDPYANAFNREANGHGHQDDKTVMGPWIWERKYELDSLCYPIQLCKDYVDATGDTGPLDETFRRALSAILTVMQTEQRHDTASDYRFERDDTYSPIDTLPYNGNGSPTNYTGMVWSGFRPSDDACTYGYLVPANMFAVVVLGHVVEFAQNIYHDTALADTAQRLREEIDTGIQTQAIVDHPRFGQIYAYETDGFGDHHLMDDANVPSLLSIPYLGYRSADDPVYRNTRAFILSPENPSYAQGKYAQGVGSPHTPKGYIWPIALIMQAMTSQSRAEQTVLLDMLRRTTGGTNSMHESFDPDDPTIYTRDWFAWANSLFGQFVCEWAANS